MYYYSTGVQEIMVLHDCIEQCAPASIILLCFDEGKIMYSPALKEYIEFCPGRLQHIKM